MFKVPIPGAARKLAVPLIFASAALAPLAASATPTFAACTDTATSKCVTTPTGGASQYDISGVTNDEAATIQTNGSNVGGVFAEGTAMIIMLKLVRKPRMAV